jgi:hypothetical protein
MNPDTNGAPSAAASVSSRAGTPPSGEILRKSGTRISRSFSASSRRPVFREPAQKKSLPFSVFGQLRFSVR